MEEHIETLAEKKARHTQLLGFGIILLIAGLLAPISIIVGAIYIMIGLFQVLEEEGEE